MGQEENQHKPREGGHEHDEVDVSVDVVEVHDLIADPARVVEDLGEVAMGYILSHSLAAGQQAELRRQEGETESGLHLPVPLLPAHVQSIHHVFLDPECPAEYRLLIVTCEKHSELSSLYEQNVWGENLGRCLWSCPCRRICTMFPVTSAALNHIAQSFWRHHRYCSTQAIAVVVEPMALYSGSTPNSSISLCSGHKTVRAGDRPSAGT